MCWGQGTLKAERKPLVALPLESVADIICFDIFRCSFVEKVISEEISERKYGSLEISMGFLLVISKMIY